MSSTRVLNFQDPYRTNSEPSRFMREVFHELCQHPVFLLELQQSGSIRRVDSNNQKYWITLARDPATTTFCVIDNNDSSELIFPQVQHWAAIAEVNTAPAWLVEAVKHLPLRDNFVVLDRIYNGHVSIQTAALILNCDQSEMVKEIKRAILSPDTIAKQLLSLSVHDSDGDENHWRIDLRGYALSVLAGQSGKASKPPTA